MGGIHVRQNLATTDNRRSYYSGTSSRPTVISNELYIYRSKTASKFIWLKFSYIHSVGKSQIYLYLTYVSPIFSQSVLCFLGSVCVFDVCVCVCVFDCHARAKPGEALAMNKHKQKMAATSDGRIRKKKIYTKTQRLFAPHSPPPHYLCLCVCLIRCTPGAQRSNRKDRNVS